ncbi:oxidoreductase [Lyophyllum atratum]|nr:oxidoreductase [Lyophyllum atratum]
MFTPAVLPTAAAGILTLLIATCAILLRKKWDPRGKHCYVTGGSAGLGLSLAILLTKKGADVSIVARNGERLQKALEQLEVYFPCLSPRSTAEIATQNARQTPNQVLKTYSFSLNDASSSAAAFDAACDGNGGKCPDAVFLCAGASRPGFFVEEDEASLRQGMDNGYWVQSWSALPRNGWQRTRFPGKIIFVSSVLGYMSMIGYSSYSPAKHALRGLAETLRSELLLYSVSVHIFFPGTIYSPGYVEENKTKPKITLKIEESDEGTQPDQAAEGLLRGVQQGHFHISADLVGNLFRSSTRGASPHNNVLMDIIYSFIGWVRTTATHHSMRIAYNIVF